MKKLVNTLTQKNIITGYLYGYVHFITEVICFFALQRVIGDNIILWIIPLMYDMLAFVPQGLIGYINDKYEKLNPGVWGTIIMSIGILNLWLNFIPSQFITIILIAIGNGFMHIAGAECTLKTSNGKLSHSAIFVSFGAYGVLAGKLLGKTPLSPIILFPIALTMIPFCLLADSYMNKSSNCDNYNYSNPSIDPFIVVLLATFVVIIRGYMGYGIPTTWNKTLYQTILLYAAMGIGKALGGILSDTFGMRKVALLSVILAVPFLVIGDNLMVVSLIGVLLFSMTMSITLGLIVSCLKNKPGLAFGFTTIGLFLGTVPIFFIRFAYNWMNSIIIGILSIVCVFILSYIIRKESG